MSVSRDKNCLGCMHHRFDLELDGITCQHPERPEDKRQVVRWMTGCPQHETLKEPNGIA